MSASESEWVHAGVSEINEERRIRIPDMIFKEAEILSPGFPVYWSYEDVIGILIVSNDILRDEEYTTVDSRKMGEEDDNFRCTIPSAFFPEKELQGSPTGDMSIPENVTVRKGERRHFMYNKRMVERDTKSCYVLSDEEFSERFEDSNTWNGTLSQVPKFSS